MKTSEDPDLRARDAMRRDDRLHTRQRTVLHQRQHGVAAGFQARDFVAQARNVIVKVIGLLSTRQARLDLSYGGQIVHLRPRGKGLKFIVRGNGFVGANRGDRTVLRDLGDLLKIHGRRNGLMAGAAPESEAEGPRAPVGSTGKPSHVAMVGISCESPDQTKSCC